jgi:hypothetical protein
MNTKPNVISAARNKQLQTVVSDTTKKAKKSWANWRRWLLAAITATTVLTGNALASTDGTIPTISPVSNPSLTKVARNLNSTGR